MCTHCGCVELGIIVIITDAQLYMTVDSQHGDSGQMYKEAV